MARRIRLMRKAADLRRLQRPCRTPRLRGAQGRRALATLGEAVLSGHVRRLLFACARAEPASFLLVFDLCGSASVRAASVATRVDVCFLFAM